MREPFLAVCLFGGTIQVRAQAGIDDWLARVIGPGLADGPPAAFYPPAMAGNSGDMFNENIMNANQLLEEMQKELEHEAFSLAKLFDQFRLFSPFGNNGDMLLPATADTGGGSGLMPFGGRGFGRPLMSMLFGPEMDIMPNVTINGADCLITVDLKGMDMNSTSIKVYSSPYQVDLEISYVKSQAMDYDNGDAAGGAEVESTNKPNLRGYASMASLTTIRSFPAPPECDMADKSSKATVDHETNRLLIKFPSKSTAAAGAVEDGPVNVSSQIDLPVPPGAEEGPTAAVAPSRAGDPPAALDVRGFQGVGDAAEKENLASQVGGPVEEENNSSPWWSLIKRRGPQRDNAATVAAVPKIPVPLVRSDEF